MVDRKRQERYQKLHILDVVVETMEMSVYL